MSVYSHLSQNYTIMYEFTPTADEPFCERWTWQEHTALLNLRLFTKINSQELFVVIGEVLYVKPDNLKEALEYDRYAMGIFKTNQEEECLVGQVAIEISSLLYDTLREDKSNSVKEKVIGKRREVGLVIPATFIAHTENKRTAGIFDTGLVKRREMFTTFQRLN